MIREGDAGRESDIIHVACCFDDRFQIPALMLAWSVRETANKARRTIFHAVATETGSLPKNIKKMLDTDHFEFKLHHVDTNILGTIDMSHAVVPSIATLCRILLPRIIPEVRRIIYLDCDIIVNKALDELYDMPMNDCAIAACFDYGIAGILASSDADADISKKLVSALIPDQHAYFNAGVLVIDRFRWIAEGYENRCLAFLENPPIPLLFADQDALNAVFHNNYVKLDDRWNVFVAKYLLIKPLPPDQQREFDFASSDPWIVHFAGDFKPWISHHPATDEDWRFWTLAKQTPFRSDVIKFCKAIFKAHQTQIEPRPPIVNRRFGEFICTLARGTAMCGMQALSKYIHVYGDRIYCLAIQEPPFNKHANPPWL